MTSDILLRPGLLGRKSGEFVGQGGTFLGLAALFDFLAGYSLALVALSFSSHILISSSISRFLLAIRSASSVGEVGSGFGW